MSFGEEGSSILALRRISPVSTRFFVICFTLETLTSSESNSGGTITSLSCNEVADAMGGAGGNFDEVDYRFFLP